MSHRTSAKAVPPRTRQHTTPALLVSRRPAVRQALLLNSIPTPNQKGSAPCDFHRRLYQDFTPLTGRPFFSMANLQQSLYPSVLSSQLSSSPLHRSAPPAHNCRTSGASPLPEAEQPGYPERPVEAATNATGERKTCCCSQNSLPNAR